MPMRLERLEGPTRSRSVASGGQGSARLWDARWSLLATVLWIVFVVSLPIGAWRVLAGAAMVLALAVGWSGVAPGPLLLRWLGLAPLLVPLSAMVAASHPAREAFGWPGVAATILAKNGLSVMAVLLLSSLHPARELLVALSRLKAPRALVATLLLMYRYLFVLADQLGRMTRARRARTFRRARWAAWPLRSDLIAALMLRSIERGERVHAAMVARGWDGTLRGLDAPASAPEPPRRLS